MSEELHNRIRERYETRLSVEPPFPTKRMKIEVSNYCNHSCIFCGRHKMTKQSGLIDGAFYKRIMQEAFDEGVREVGLFINGEPFTNSKLHELIRIAKQIGYEYIYLTTNGALATPKRLKEAIDAGLDSIKYSINAATKETYEKIHGRNDFETVISNLKYAIDYRNISNKKYNIFGSFVATSHSSKEIPLFKKRYVSLFDDFAFYKVRSNGLMQENKEMCIEEATPQSYCTLPFNTINIDYDASLLACCEDINHRIPIADLNVVPLREAWYCNAMKKLRQSHINRVLSGTVCEECLAGGGGVVEVLES